METFIKKQGNSHYILVDLRTMRINNFKAGDVVDVEIVKITKKRIIKEVQHGRGKKRTSKANISRNS